MGRISKLQKIKPLKICAILHYSLLPLLLTFLLSSCTTYRTLDPDKSKISLISTQTEIPENQLLDVRIQIFDPGNLPSSKEEQRGLSPEIQKAEAHYIPTQLKKAMQQTGHWGAVRVVPLKSVGDEVLVTGRILKSDGEQLILEISAKDATGEQWFKKKIFTSTVSERMYRDSINNQVEVFQNIYNRIANELSLYRINMSLDQIRNIRQVAEMRFAEKLVPNAFRGYLKRTKKNKLSINRLPSENDETLARVKRVRERDYMLIDTIDSHFENIEWNMQDVYTNWRKSRLTEMNMIRSIERRRNVQRWKGAGAILGGVLLAVAGSQDGNYSPITTGVGIAAVATGTALIVRAEEISRETEINKVALEELGASFAANIEPIVVKVEGETVKLTGNAEAKYQKWQNIISDLYRIETEEATQNTELIPDTQSFEKSLSSH